MFFRIDSLELKSIKLELKFIREHMIDVDAILTEEEKKLLDESIKHEKEGKLVSLEEIKLKQFKIA
jgi:hypothetical protein